MLITYGSTIYLWMDWACVPTHCIALQWKSQFGRCYLSTQLHSALLTCICKNPLQVGRQIGWSEKRVPRDDTITGLAMYSDALVRFWPVDPHCLGRPRLDQVSKGGDNDRLALPPAAFSHPGGRAHGNSIAVTGGHILPIHYLSPDLFGSFH